MLPVKRKCASEVPVSVADQPAAAAAAELRVDAPLRNDPSSSSSVNAGESGGQVHDVSEIVGPLPPLPAEWIAVPMQGGHVCYQHALLGRQQWDHPLMPAGWIALTASSGRRYYFSEGLNKTQWNFPTRNGESEQSWHRGDNGELSRASSSQALPSLPKPCTTEGDAEHCEQMRQAKFVATKHNKRTNVGKICNFPDEAAPHDALHPIGHSAAFGCGKGWIPDAAKISAKLRNTSPLAMANADVEEGPAAELDWLEKFDSSVTVLHASMFSWQHHYGGAPAAAPSSIQPHDDGTNWCAFDQWVRPPHATSASGYVHSMQHPNGGASQSRIRGLLVERDSMTPEQREHAANGVVERCAEGGKCGVRWCVCVCVCVCACCT